MKLKSVGKVLFLCAALSCLFGAGDEVFASQAGQTGASAYQATAEKCSQCHADVTKQFTQSIHGNAAKFVTGTRAASCETCHGDLARHVATADPNDILNPAKMSPADVNATCLSCHAREQRRMLWDGSQHDNSKISCVTCHSVHHPKAEKNLLVKRTEDETCLSCHTSQIRVFNQRSTHLFRTERKETKVGCASCHNPHGGEAGKMLVSRTANDLCYTCHAEKRGPFLWEHAPVREDCMSCHSPHGTNNAKLLTARVQLLCQSCHIHLLPRHSTVAGKPLDIWTLNRGCANCHSQIHGSNHPSGRTFTR